MSNGSSSSPKVVARHMALYDVHVPHNIDLNPVYAFARYYKPTHLIIGGDFLNLEWASHWNDSDFAQIGWTKVSKWLKQEIEAAKIVLGDIKKSVPKDCQLFYIPGNHEEWLRLLGTTYRQVLDQAHIDIDKMNFKTDFAKVKKQHLATLLDHHLGLSALGFKVLPYDQHLTLGKINYVHGHRFGGQIPAKQSVEKVKRTVVFGHHHTHQTHTATSPMNSRDVHMGIAVPCLTGLAPGFLETTSTRWLNGFFTANIFESGAFNHYIIPIIEGAIVLPDGRILS